MIAPYKNFVTSKIVVNQSNIQRDRDDLAESHLTCTRCLFKCGTYNLDKTQLTFLSHEDLMLHTSC